MTNMRELKLGDFVALQDIFDSDGRGVCGWVGGRMPATKNYGYSISLSAPEGQVKYYQEHRWKVVYHWRKPSEVSPT